MKPIFLPLITTWKLLLLHLLLLLLSSLRRVISLFYSLWPFNLQWILDHMYFRSPLLQSLFSFHLQSGNTLESNSIAEDLAKKSGLCFEDHTVVTEDGFVLSIHRCYVPYGVDETERETRPPVLVMHGLMQDSESFLCGGSDSFVHALASAGYDVWLGNNRGNKYSCNHIHLSCDMDSYWDYCIDDLAHYDVPACVNYVLRTTSRSSLAYVGFSQGSAQAFAALCRHAGLNSKVSIFVALAPAVRSPGLHDTELSEVIHANHSVLYSIFGTRAMLSSCLVWRSFLSRSLFAFTVEKAMFYLFNWTCLNISPQRRVQLFEHAYSYSSVKCVMHWFQIINTGALSCFDVSSTGSQSCRYCDDLPENSYSSCVNRREYCYQSGAKERPYDISTISCPVAVLYGGADRLIDAKAAVSQLKQCVYEHEEPLYEHLDMIWADTARDNIFPRVVEVLKKYN